jgi:predicted  nucleic acid-binding Zn-ribbon protein
MNIFFPLPVSEMTSVLNGGGLNYQIGNPVRYEITKVNTLVSDLKKVVDAQGADIKDIKAKSSDNHEIAELKTQVGELKSQIANLERMNRDVLATIASMRS